MGVAGSSLMIRLIRHFLFEVAPYDPETIGVVSLLLMLIAGIAAWLPARRAAYSDPMSSLKCD
jgi:ABC-type antimicrobial peptide transport system permease subunit